MNMKAIYMAINVMKTEEEQDLLHNIYCACQLHILNYI